MRGREKVEEEKGSQFRRRMRGRGRGRGRESRRGGRVTVGKKNWREIERES